jgi:hypothetical protein
MLSFMTKAGLKFNAMKSLLHFNHVSKEIPSQYKIFKYLVVLRIPEFERYWSEDAFTLSPENVDTSHLYESFIRRIISSIEARKYLPIIRLSDGEYQFLFGDQPFSCRYSLAKRFFLHMRRVVGRVINGNHFRANTAPGVSSGDYSKDEVIANRAKYTGYLKYISEKGILALHLTIGKEPFQEHYLPALGGWLAANQIELDLRNYVPFYFVYAAFRGSYLKSLIGSRRILIINGATGSKKKRIIAALYSFDVLEIYWVDISNDRSFYDKVELDGYVSKIDLCLLGAGVGKPNILIQAEQLNVPCIDIGFVFEVWADKDNELKRPYMIAK